MIDSIRDYKLRKIKRRVKTRQDKDFNPSLHPRAEEGETNAQGQKNGGQFVKKEEASGFKGAERYKRGNVGKPFIGYNEYKKRVESRAQDAIAFLSGAMKKSNVTSRYSVEHSLKSVIASLEPGAILNLYTTEKGKKKKNIAFSFYKDQMGDVRFVHPDGREDIVDHRNPRADIAETVAPALFKFYVAHKDDYRPKVSVDINESELKRGYESEYSITDNYGGFYSENNEGKDIKNFSPNPSVLCMIAPPVIKHLDESFDYIDSEANKQILSSALSTSVVADSYTSPLDSVKCFYSHGSEMIYLSEDCAQAKKEPSTECACTVAHEAAHSYDFKLGKQFGERTYSELYNKGEFLEATRKDVGDFLSRYGYTDSMAPEEYASIRESIIRDLSDKGFTMQSTRPFSDMIDSYTKGKLNLGYGHSFYIGFRWENDNSSREAYANQMGSLERILSRQLLEYVAPNATRTFDKMNRDIAEWQKNPLSKYVPLPLSLVGDYTKLESVQNVLKHDKERSYPSLRDKLKEDPSAQISEYETSRLKSFLGEIPYGSVITFTGTNPKTHKTEDMEIVRYKDGYNTKHALLTRDHDTIQDGIDINQDNNAAIQAYLSAITDHADSIEIRAL